MKTAALDTGIQLLLIGIISLTGLDASASGSKAAVENDRIKVEYDLSAGQYRVTDKQDASARITGCFSQVAGWRSTDSGYKHTSKKSTVQGELGKGKKLTVLSSSETQPNLILEITLYDGEAFVVLAGGVENNGDKPIQVKQIAPLAGGLAFEGFDLTQNFSMLAGVGGHHDVHVLKKGDLRSPNNLLATFGDGAARRSIVIGGLRNREYVKFVEANRKGNALNIRLSAEDTVGKRIDPGTRYIPDDSFYVDFTTTDPFENLEAYARTVRTALNIELSIYDFPTVDLWYARGSGAKNNTVGAVAEMDKVIATGFLKYAPVAVCMEPDYYGEYNQQGWWDDEHFQAETPIAEERPDWAQEAYQGYGRYVVPYETSEKWAAAVRERGGIPFIYMQPGMRNQGYADAFPEHMLFNNARALKRDSNGKVMLFPKEMKGLWYWNAGRPMMESYDYTDPGFVAHMRDVYANYEKTGIKGIKFDYPSHLWADRGGMEDKYSTATSAYRTTFRLAKEEMGKDSYLHERNLNQGYDVALGLVDVQRIVGDTQELNPEMVRNMALRWYKNRVLINLDNDSKHLPKAMPKNRDGVRSMLTLSYVGSGRLMLGTCFDKMSEEDVYDLSRTFPYHSQPKSARPVDMFVREVPQIFDFAVNDDWHQVTLYNPDYEANDEISLVLSGDPVAGELTLDRKAAYYVYDFWNNAFVGKFAGSETVKQVLRPGEARMLSVHKALERPQFISTDRHVMQGYVDLSDVKWDAEKNHLSGRSKVVTCEPYKVVIAANAYQAISCYAGKAKCSVRMIGDGLAELTLEHFESGPLDWRVDFVPEPPLPDVYLSDLTPIEATTGFGQIQKNKSVEGKPLTIAGQVYEKGLGMHANATLVYQLKPEYKRFVAVVGVDDEVTGRGTVEFTVYADGQLIAETGLVPVGDVQFIDVEIPAGAKQIKLEALQGADGMNFDHADWVNAGFVLK